MINKKFLMFLIFYGVYILLFLLLSTKSNIMVLNTGYSLSLSIMIFCKWNNYRLTKIFLILLITFYSIGNFKLLSLYRLINYQVDYKVLNVSFSMLSVISLVNLILLIKKRAITIRRTSPIYITKKAKILKLVVIIFYIFSIIFLLLKFSSYGIPHITTDHFKFRKLFAANLITATISRWMIFSFMIFSIIITIKNKKKYLNILLLVITFFIIVLLASRALLLLGIIPVFLTIFIYSNYTKLKFSFKKIIFSILTIFGSIIGIEILRSTAKINKGFFVYILRKFGFFNQLLVYNNLCNSGFTNFDFLKDLNYPIYLIKSLLPNSILSVFGVEGQKLFGKEYAQAMGVENILGISIGHINELFLINENIIIPFIVILIITYIIFKLDEKIIDTKAFTIDTLTNHSYYCVIMLASFLFFYISPGAFFYYTVFLFGIPFFFYKMAKPILLAITKD